MEKRVTRYVGGAHGERVEYEPGKWTDSWFSTTIILGIGLFTDFRNLRTFEDLPHWCDPSKLNIKNKTEIEAIIQQNKTVLENLEKTVGENEFTYTENDLTEFSLAWYEIGSENLENYWKQEYSTRYRPYNRLPVSTKMTRKEHIFEIIADHIQYQAAKSPEGYRVMLDPEPIEWILKTPAAVEYLGDMHTYLRERFPDIEFSIYTSYRYIDEARDEPYNWDLVTRAISTGFFHPDITLCSAVYYYDIHNDWTTREVFDRLMNDRGKPWGSQRHSWKAWWGVEAANIIGCKCELLGTGIAINGSYSQLVRKDYLDMFLDMADKYGYDRTAIWGSHTSPTSPWVKSNMEASNYLEQRLEQWYD